MYDRHVRAILLKVQRRNHKFKRLQVPLHAKCTYGIRKLRFVECMRKVQLTASSRAFAHLFMKLVWTYGTRRRIIMYIYIHMYVHMAGSRVISVFHQSSVEISSRWWCRRELRMWYAPGVGFARLWWLPLTSAVYYLPPLPPSLTEQSLILDTEKMCSIWITHTLAVSL